MISIVFETNIIKQTSGVVTIELTVKNEQIYTDGDDDYQNSSSNIQYQFKYIGAHQYRWCGMEKKKVVNSDRNDFPDAQTFACFD